MHIQTIAFYDQYQALHTHITSMFAFQSVGDWEWGEASYVVYTFGCVSCGF